MAGADINQQSLLEDDGGMTPLLLSLHSGNNVTDMCHLLLSHKADVHAERIDTRLVDHVLNYWHYSCIQSVNQILFLLT